MTGNDADFGDDSENEGASLIMKLIVAAGYFILFGVLVLIVLYLQWWCWEWIEQNIPEKDRGPFGDMFGSVNTLFSGLAFAGVLFAIFLQSWELSATRSELKLTRVTHQKTKKILDKQLEILEKTAAIEEARYRDQFLPVFVSDTESGSSGSGGLVNCIRKIKNTGKVIKDLTVKLAENKDNAELWEMPPVQRAHLITNADFQINYKSLDSKVLPPLVCDVEFTTATDERKWKCQFIIERTTGASKREFRFTQITERIEN